MNNLIKRVIAYIIDMLVVLLIVQLISGIPAINKDLNKYNKYYKEYSELITEYTSIKQDLINYNEDKEIDEKEYNKLIEYEEYKDIINTYYEDKKITEKELVSINSKIDKDFNKKNKKIYCNIEKSSKYNFVIYIIVVIGYFIAFNIITDGRTLGKKIMKLKIVNTNNESVELKGYIIRSIFLYQLLLYITRLILVSTLNSNDYYNTLMLINNIMVFVEVAIIVTVGIRQDGRGLHDLLAGTKVVRLDKEGNIIESINPTIRKKLKKENSTNP